MKHAEMTAQYSERVATLCTRNLYSLIKTQTLFHLILSVIGGYRRVMSLSEHFPNGLDPEEFALWSSEVWNPDWIT